MSNSIPLDPSALQDQSKQLRRISSKPSTEISAESVVVTPHYEVSTRSVDDDLNQPIIVVENVIPSSFKHTIADNDNHQGKYISMVTDPMISGLINDSNSSNANMIETKQSLANIFSEIDVVTSPISIAIEPTNTSSDLIVPTTTASQSIESTIGTIANEQIVSKEEQDKSALLAARLKAKLEEKAYMIPSFSNLLIDPYNPSTDPYSSSAGTEDVNTGSTTTTTSTNTRINPVPTSEPIKVWSASTPLELGDLSPTNARSRSSTPDKMSARKASKKSKKNSITSSNVSDDGMGDNAGISASATVTDRNNISRNSSSNSIATSTASTPNRKSGVSKRGGETNDRDGSSSSSSTQVTALDSPGVGGVGTKRASMAGPKVKNIKDLKIKVRPTEPLRSGYLHKLDMNLLPIDGTEHAEEEEDEAWTAQYVTMDVTTGQLEYFTEINSNRIKRGQIDVRACKLKVIDTSFHRRINVFRISYKTTTESNTPLSGSSSSSTSVVAMDSPIMPSASDESISLAASNNTNKHVMYFAAADEETLNYWLISFYDALKHSEELKAQQQQLLSVSTDAPSITSTADSSSMLPSTVIPDKKASLLPSSPAADGSRDGTSPSSSGPPPSVVLKDDSKKGDRKDIGGNDAERGKTRVSTTVDARSALMNMLNKRNMVDSDATVVNSNSNSSSSGVSDKIDGDGQRSSEPLNTTITMDVLTSNDRNSSNTSDIQSLPIQHTSTAPPVPPPPSPIPAVKVNPRDALLSKLKLSLNKVSYPAKKLARRIKVWYSSSGFSLTSDDEIQIFIQELRKSGDPVLISFAEEKFNGISDWANLLDLLRKYEQRVVVDDPKRVVMKEVVHAEDKIVFDVKATLPNSNSVALQSSSSSSTKTITTTTTSSSSSSSSDTTAIQSNNNNDSSSSSSGNSCVVEPSYKSTSKIILKDDFEFGRLVSTIASDFGLSDVAVEKQLPDMLCGPGRVLHVGLNMLKDELTFAEDLILYQEEVINNLWQSFTSLKKTSEHKDETINQLYYRLSTHQGDGKDPTSSTAGVGLSDKPHDIEFFPQARVIPVRTPGQETATVMNLTHQAWMEEKRILILAHNETKQRLNNEILMLRKIMTPEQQKSLIDQKHWQHLNATLEEELVNAHISNDNLKAEIETLNKRLQESENEKAVIESHYQDHLKKIMDQYDQGVVTYKEKLKAKYAKQANEIIQRNRIQIQHISSSNSTIKTAPPTATAFPPPPSLPPPASSLSTSDGNGNPNTATTTSMTTTTTSTSTASTAAAAATVVATMNGTASNGDVGGTASNALSSTHHSVSFGFSSNGPTTISSNSISSNTQQLPQTSQVSEYTPVSALINTRNASSYYPINTSNPPNHNASNHHLYHPSKDLPSAGLYDAYNYSTEIKEEQLLTESLSKRWIDRYLDASTMQQQPPSIHHNQSVQSYNSKSMLMEPMETSHIDSSSSSARRHNGLNSGHSVISYSTAGAMQQQLSSSSSVASATTATTNYNNNYQGNNNNISGSTSSNSNNRSVSPRARQKATQSSSSTLPMNQQHHLLVYPSSASSNSANQASAMSSYASYENLRVSRSAVQFSSPLRQALKKNITLSSSSSSSASAMPSSSFLGPSRLSMTNNNNNYQGNNNNNNNYQGNNSSSNNISVGYNNIDAATGKHFMADTSSRKQKVSEGRDPVVTNNSYLGKQRSSGAWKWSN